MSVTAGPRPDITPPQIVAIVTAGIPILASLLNAFGVYSMGPEQQDALSDAVTWAGVTGAALIGGDAALRTARNKRKGIVEAVLAEGGLGDQLEIVQDITTPQLPAGIAAAAGFEEPPAQTPPPASSRPGHPPTG